LFYYVINTKSQQIKFVCTEHQLNNKIQSISFLNNFDSEIHPTTVYQRRQDYMKVKKQLFKCFEYKKQY